MARRRAQRGTAPERATGPGPAGRDDRYDRDHETAAERLDRNWNELLQELRVTQTGVQILTGFLLTLPFQERFTDLDHYQRTVYLVLVVLAVITTGLIVAPVSLHRIMFRKHLKAELVESADKLARAGLVFLGLTITGAALLVFDVVLDRTAGYLVGGAVLVLLAVLWFLVPVRLTRTNQADGG
jgi:Family of unknown function (DUF6328)